MRPRATCAPLPLLLSLVAAGAQAQPACGEADRLQLEAVLASGGTLDLDCAGSIAIDETLVADGVIATVIGPAVSIRPTELAPPIRLLEVRGSTLVFDGISWIDGTVIGANGADG